MSLDKRQEDDITKHMGKVFTPVEIEMLTPEEGKNRRGATHE